MGYKADNKRVVTFQVAKSEHECLKAIATRKNCTVSDLIRDAVFEMYIEDETDQNSPIDTMKAALKAGHRAAITHLEINLAQIATENPNEPISNEQLAADAKAKYGTTLEYTTQQAPVQKEA